MGNICLVCCDGGKYCVMPSTCVQLQQQVFCLDARASFPCSEKVPCMCTALPGMLLFVNYGFNFGCCVLVGDKIDAGGGESSAKPSAVAPEPDKAPKPIVAPDKAKAFLQSLKDEYVEGKPAAVGDVINQFDESEVKACERFEQRVRDAS